MCKAVLESGADQQTAESLNDGIAITTNSKTGITVQATSSNEL